jgi:hypothetical protein
MTSFEPVQVGPYLLPSDPPNLAQITKDISDWAAGRLNMRFSTTAARDAAIPAPVEGMYCTTGTGATLVQWLYVSAAWLDIRRTGITMGTPTATVNAGTPTVGTTETRDAVLGNYTFTAIAGRRYRAVVDGMAANGNAVGDTATWNIRNGGASTPTAASTLVASMVQLGVVASGAAGRIPVALSGTFVPGAGVVTLSVFVVRATGTGVMTPVGTREFYAVDMGPA